MKITVNKEIVEKIEALQYEVESRKDVIVQILANGLKVSGDTFDKYQEEYRKFFIEYNKAKQDMLEKCQIPNDVMWNLDFSSCVLTLED